MNDPCNDSLATEQNSLKQNQQSKMHMVGELELGAVFEESSSWFRGGEHLREVIFLLALADFHLGKSQCV